MSRTNILLLRTPDSPDRYETAFSSAGYTTASVPALETALVHHDTLTDIIRRGSEYGGVIITSGRGCEAWEHSVGTLPTSSALTTWKTTPFYVVGRSSASKLEDIQSLYPDSPFTPHDIRGESTGNSEQLARFILADFPSPPSKPLLYLTGDKNRDTLPEILRAGGLELAPLQVYKTQGSSTFPNDLKLALDNFKNSDGWWIVFFAPSTAEFVLPFLREHFDLHSADASIGRRAKIAAIGPTTSTFLQKQLDLSVDVVAQTPTPYDLLEYTCLYR
ncbi:tetrapyrrole biosynthesis, uroporphyrinogen III synthase [Mycena amicta]|nr:tetrapyrrole biosynthesis, uroporphyrinogen III synthase [Mycena amicta]